MNFSVFYYPQFYFWGIYLIIKALENGFPPGCEKIRLPAEPKATCSQVLQNKIIQVTERMEKYNYSINEDIHKKKSFKNPSIYEKLIELNGINEFGSSFPNVSYDLLFVLKH